MKHVLDSMQDDAPKKDDASIAPAHPRASDKLSRPVPTKTKRPPRSWIRRFLRGTGRRLTWTWGALGVNLLSKTWRPIFVGTENLEAARGEGGGYFISLWHGRMLVPMASHKNRGWTVLVSKSRDGDLIERMLLRFGFRVIRGSTSRGGATALREMLEALKQGGVMIITPDGPRGPMHSMNPGLVWMARETGYSVVPSGFVASRAWRAKSWDRFTLPKPFARLAFVYGPPIAVAHDASNAELEKVSLVIREAMLAAERRGFELLGLEPAP